MIRLLPVLWLFFSSAILAGKQPVPAEYVGGDSCVRCHAEQVKLWQGSHHDLAMQYADEDSVLGNFSEEDFSYAGITSRFYKKNDLFMVRTDGPDGQLHEYEIKYTFGVYPLQQYLVELEGGRLQALTISWDARPKSEGGQRWFHLYPDEAITYNDELHWTRNMFNWNGMCAECHSTNLQRNYDSEKDVFTTSWSEIDVSCEACHGPASNHLAWANKQSGGGKLEGDKGLEVVFDERDGVHWRQDSKTGIASRSQPRKTQKEIDVCAPCHSRRSVISTDYSPGKPYLDHYMPRLLDEGMYFVDGQIQDEVYVYGSFLQSRMYHKGVSCSDCHEPHSLELKQQGNAVCLQCHAADKFDTKKHHLHDSNSTGALCAECHMPPTTYMVVDPRHDHSMRIPRPDLSVSLGVPNACNRCHEDKDASWAAELVKQWYGKTPVGFQQYAEAFDAARSGKSGAGEMLVAQINELETPDIARASAISMLPPYLDQSSFEVISKGLNDDDAMVRMASVTALENLPQEILVQLAFPLLDDPVRVVRIEAARVLAPVPAGELKGKQLAVYSAAANEYVASQQANADRPAAQLSLGNYYAARGEYDKAIASYRKAIELENLFIPAYVNLADLYRVQQDDKAAANILKQAISLTDDASAYHALGLLKIRQQEIEQAIVMLQRAAEFDASNVRYVYVYAVALNSTGEKTRAIEVLQEAQSRFPQNRDVLEALVAFHRDAGNEFAAQTYMKKLQKLNQ
jgi:predicted CXXCH cytochrome family protein